MSYRAKFVGGCLDGETYTLDGKPESCLRAHVPIKPEVSAAQTTPPTQDVVCEQHNYQLRFGYHKAYYVYTFTGDQCA